MSADEVAKTASPSEMIDQRIKELWDRSWVLYLLVTLFGLEWLTRKLLRLA